MLVSVQNQKNIPSDLENSLSKLCALINLVIVFISRALNIISNQVPLIQVLSTTIFTYLFFIIRNICRLYIQFLKQKNIFLKYEMLKGLPRFIKIIAYCQDRPLILDLCESGSWGPWPIMVNSEEAAERRDPFNQLISGGSRDSDLTNLLLMAYPEDRPYIL